MTDLQNPIFTDLDAAREALEAVRWPNGPYCPHCGNSDTEKIAKIEGKKHSHRPGLYYCNECKGQFTVTVGTVFERSKVPLTKWWMATHLMSSSKKGISAHQLHRMLGVTYKTAWLMAHRVQQLTKIMTLVLARNGGLTPQEGLEQVAALPSAADHPLSSPSPPENQPQKSKRPRSEARK
jgi:transposase-like protein